MANWEQFKLQKNEFKGMTYMIFKIEDSSEIVIDSTGPIGATYPEFVEALTASGSPRYGVFDAKYSSADEREVAKIVFVAYNPDSAKIREKMIYSGSKEYLTRSLPGIGVSINATDFSELEFESCVLSELKK